MKNMHLLDLAQKTELSWLKIAPAMFETSLNGEKLKLKLNDFPDEVLLTLFIRNEKFDLEERPRNWHLE